MDGLTWVNLEIYSRFTCSVASQKAWHTKQHVPALLCISKARRNSLCVGRLGIRFLKPSTLQGEALNMWGGVFPMSGTAALDELTPHIDIEDFFANIVEATATWPWQSGIKSKLVGQSPLNTPGIRVSNTRTVNLKALNQ